MQKELEQHNVDTLNRLKSLFKFSQGAAHVWDVHELGLAKQERALQEKLDQCRLLHDTQNQVSQFTQFSHNILGIHNYYIFISYSLNTVIYKILCLWNYFPTDVSHLEQKKTILPYQ